MDKNFSTAKFGSKTQKCNADNANTAALTQIFADSDEFYNLFNDSGVKQNHTPTPSSG